jgi:hypothetical protein
MKTALLTKTEWEYVESLQDEFGFVYGSEGTCIPIRPKMRVSPLVKYSDLTEDKKREIITLRIAGVTWAHVMKRFRITATCLYRIQVENGYKYPNNLPQGKASTKNG